MFQCREMRLNANCKRDKNISYTASQKPSKIWLLEMIPTRDAEEMLRCLLYVGFFGSLNMKWAAASWLELAVGASEGPAYAKSPIKQDQKS